VFASLGRFVYRRRVPVVLAWVLLLGVGLGVGGQVFGRLGSGSGLRDDAESVVVSDRLSRVGGGGTGISGLIDGRPAGDPAFRAEVNAAVKDLEATPASSGSPAPGPRASRSAGIGGLSRPRATAPRTIRWSPGTGGRCWSGSSWRAG
jgi:hypothetical protein